MIGNETSKESGWWVDYIEGELDPCCRQTAKMILEVSELDRTIIINYLKLREFIKHSCNTEADMSHQLHENQSLQDYFNGFKSKVMDKIKKNTGPKKEQRHLKIIDHLKQVKETLRPWMQSESSHRFIKSMRMKSLCPNKNNEFSFMRVRDKG